jgi:aldose 1-epimerase
MGRFRLQVHAMSRFSVTESSLGKFPLLVLADERRGLRLRVALRGATVVGIDVPEGDGHRNLADGYRDEAELQAAKSARFAIMAPFANRIADGRYRFDGVDYDLQPGVTADRGVRHGFLRTETYELIEQAEGDDGACIVLRSQHVRPGAHDGYPFSIDVTVRYALTPHGIELTTTLTNVGDTAAPAFFGWHPYFKPGDDAVDGWELHIPADTFIKADAGSIPLPDTAAWVPMDDVDPALDFRTLRAIGAVHLDNTFTDLQYGSDGRARTTLRHRANGLQVSVWQTHGVMLVFSGDTVPREPRTSVAMEPMECMANAFNRDDCAPLVRLEAGASRSYACGIEINT